MIQEPMTPEQPAQPQNAAQSQQPAPHQSTAVQQPAALANDPRRRSPFLAAALSTVPGLGQVYLGFYQLGFVNAIVIGAVITLLATGDMGPLIPLASIFLAFFYLYNIIDAARRAVLVNEVLAGRTNVELPDDFAAPGLVGSVLGGSILVIVGLVLLSRTLFGVSLEWLEDWWPIAIVLFGVFLIYKARSDHRQRPAAAQDDD